MPWYIWIALIILIVILYNYYKVKLRRETLLNKYKDPELVEKLMKRQFWLGMPTEQLIDSLGQPETISEQVLKTKKKETYKYHKTGTNRFALKIVIENDEIVGWDQK